MKRRIWRIIENVRTPPTTGIHPDNDNFVCGWETCHMLLRSRIKRALSRKWWKFRAPKVLLITLALLLGGCVHVKMPDGTEYWRVGEQQIGEVLFTLPDGTEFLMDGQKSELPKVEITATNITIGGKVVKP